MSYAGVPPILSVDSKRRKNLADTTPLWIVTTKYWGRVDLSQKIVSKKLSLPLFPIYINKIMCLQHRSFFNEFPNCLNIYLFSQVTIFFIRNIFWYIHSVTVLKKNILRVDFDEINKYMMARHTRNVFITCELFLRQITFQNRFIEQ